MKYIHHMMKRLGTRHIGLLMTVWLLSLSALAQIPVISQIDKTSGKNGERITLQGSFNGDAARTVVTFGAARGHIDFISDQLLEVLVPPGATYDNIVVTDLNSGLSAESKVPFLYSFGGASGITAANLEGQVDFQSGSGLYDVCMCDFDNDGRNDIATANNNTNQINVFANTTPAPGLGNISFDQHAFLLGAVSVHVRCGDLNGDGKPDLIVSEGGATAQRIFLFRNTSTGPGAFTFSVVAVTLTGTQVKRMEIADLDGDGKPEVIVTNQSGNVVTILVNQSTATSISFSPTRITLTVTGAASTDALTVEDLNNDGLPEIITGQFLTPTSNIFVFQNSSTPGSIAFSQQPALPAGTIVNLRVGDLDGDGKPDIAGTELVSPGSVIVFRNQSTTNVSFAAPVNFTAGGRPWGLDIGDIDGDGKAEIVVASLEKTVSILNNQSTPGTLSFTTVTLPTTYINRHVVVGDIDGDAKPDIVFTSVDDENNAIPASKVSVFRNKTCLVPTLEPTGPLTICTGFPLQLTTEASPGTTYEWKNGGTTVASGTDPFFNVTASGSYTVTAISEGGSCSETSNAVSVTVEAGTTSGTAIATNNGPACPGGTVNLSVNDVGGTQYLWTGPAGYSGSGLTPAPITGFDAEKAGRYYLDVIVNGCIAQQSSTVVEMINVPDFQVTHSGSETICPPDTKTLSITPNDPNFAYQWAEVTTGDIAGATGSTLNVSASGQYYVKASHHIYPGCAALETDPVTITFTSPPVADFTAPANTCTSTVINFADQSTGASGQTLHYSWDFGDGSAVSTEQNPTHQYTTANNYTITLTVSYANGGCQQVATKPITVEQAPVAAIVTDDNATGICPGGSLGLALNNSFSTYQWNTGETTESIVISQPGIYSVEVTTGGCRLTVAVDIEALEGPTVIATADPTEIAEGGTSQLMAVGLSNYEWTPTEWLSDPNINNPIASPLQTTVYTVSGFDDEGCPGSSTVEVRVKGDFIVNKLVPMKFISPNNGDDINTFWRVENIQDYPQCGVTIYDDKGIAVHNAKPYNNDWDGTYNGRDLPDGVYYFVIRCDGEEGNPRTGSITLLR